MKNLIFISTLFTVALFSNLSRAEIYVEPAVGYSLGRYTSDYYKVAPAPTGPGSTDVGLGGLAYEAKAGFSFPLVAFGADYLGSAFTLSGSASTSEDIGVFARLVPFPFINLAASYFFTSKVVNSDTTSTGNGFKFGIGTSILPLLNINLDYVANHYNSVGPSSPTAYSTASADMTRFILSLSIPLRF